MKKTGLLLCLLILSLNVKAERYVFFVHNMFLEIAALNDVHPEYGRCEYNEILDAFRNKGFVVISEIRPKNTDGIAYARKIAKQVDSLLAKGVQPGDITVIGTSKGGYIAQHASGLLKNGQLNFVFIGSCGDEPATRDLEWHGNILSIYEETDAWRSCEKVKAKAGKNITRFKEVGLNTGLKHGFLYKASPLWIDPAAKWAKQQYD